MDKIDSFKKNNNICFIYIKNLDKHFTNNFEKRIKVILNSLINKFER